MLWEWEDGEEAGRQSEEVPVDFDFISLLSKPKVNPKPPIRSVSSIYSPKFSIFHRADEPHRLSIGRWLDFSVRGADRVNGVLSAVATR
jgi:hypothetical protein